MIEKNIFQSWHTRELHPEFQKKINELQKSNPEYSYHLYTDEDMDNFVNNNFNGEISECYNKLNIIVAKVDFWRYLVLYKYGGVYFDMDSSIDKPLHELITEQDEAIITAERNPNKFVQWGLIYKKNHPILKRTIELIVENIKTNKYPNNILKMTGPDVISQALFEIHYEQFNNNLDWYSISENTDITYSSNNISYRIYGVDYNTFLSFRNNFSHFLTWKTHWTEDERRKPLLLV